MSTTAELFQRFVDIIAALRNPNGGCPWDLEQDHKSLRPYLIEEAYEVLHAIDSQDDHELSKELGDVLLQVVLHAQLAKDRGAFNIDQVIQYVAEKMIRRHPHVFGSTKVANSAEVLKNWENIKLGEKGSSQAQSDTPSGVLASIPQALPALLRAQRLGEKAAKFSFDWKHLGGVWEKVQEELQELRAELNEHQQARRPLAPNSSNRERLEHELGDALFSLCQLARWMGLSAEDALRSASDRFLRRFKEMENLSKRPLTDHSEDELEDLWQQAKIRLAGN